MFRIYKLKCTYFVRAEKINFNSTFLVLQYRPLITSFLLTLRYVSPRGVTLQRYGKVTTVTLL